MALAVASFAATCAICYGIFHIVMWHLRRRRLYEMASKFEGPLALPIIGNAHMFLGNTEDLLIKIDEVLNSYPSPCRVWFGPVLAFFINDPDQANAICTSSKTLDKGELLMTNARPVFGTGLLTAPVSKWRAHRKLIQPTFNTTILESFMEVFVAQSKISAELIERNLDGPEFKLFDLLSSCTLDMICETAMGIKVEAQTHGNSNYVEALQKTLGSVMTRFFHFWLQPDFIFYRTKLGQDQRKWIKHLHEFTDNVIQVKRKNLLERGSQPGAADNEDDASDSKPRRKAFLDLLMEPSVESGNLSDEELRDEVLTMVFSGNDTSAITTSFLMLMLASHPDIQDKVYEEIYEIYGDSDCDERPVLSKDLARMKYLECAMKETMRLFPVVPYIIREATEDVDIGEHSFPTGSTIALGILNLQRNEMYWPDPLKFQPDRFLPKETARRHPHAYMAFSTGPRNCIGIKYGMMSIKTLIATILRRYVLKKDDIVPIKDIRLKLDIVLSTVDPITIRIERRTRN